MNAFWLLVEGVSLLMFSLFAFLGIRKQGRDLRKAAIFVAIAFGFMAVVIMTIDNI